MGWGQEERELVPGNVKCIFPSKGGKGSKDPKIPSPSACDTFVRVLRGNTLDLVLSDLAQGMTLLTGKKCFPRESEYPLPLSVSTVGIPVLDLRLLVVAIFHHRECRNEPGQKAMGRVGRKRDR